MFASIYFYVQLLSFILRAECFSIRQAHLARVGYITVVKDASLSIKKEGPLSKLVTFDLDDVIFAASEVTDDANHAVFNAFGLSASKVVIA